MIPDSAFMVLLWRIRTGERINRVSGLEYLREFFSRHSVRRPGNVFWVMASEQSAARNLRYLQTQGIEVDAKDCYIAPRYAAEVTDPELVRRIQAGRYAHVVITVGGGKQEQLGLYLKRNLQPVPGFIVSARPSLSSAAIRFTSQPGQTDCGSDGSSAVCRVPRTIFRVIGRRANLPPCFFAIATGCP